MIRTNLSTRPFYNETAVRIWLMAFAVLAVAATVFNAQRLYRYSRTDTELAGRRKLARGFGGALPVAAGSKAEHRGGEGQLVHERLPKLFCPGRIGAGGAGWHTALASGMSASRRRMQLRREGRQEYSLVNAKSRLPHVVNRDPSS